MILARFIINGRVHRGQVEGGMLQPYGSDNFERPYAIEEVRLLPPCELTKIVAVGLNYRDHAEEMKVPLPEEPLLFMKPASSVIAHHEAIVLPPQSARVDYEAELAVVIGKTAKNVSRSEAAEFIWGYTCLNDVTARDLQSKDGQWTRAKGFDTFCPLGPWLVTDLDPSDLAIGLYLNGDPKQQSRTSNLIFDCAQLVEFISGIMTLLPGDVIATGTSSGIGPMQEGDEVEVRIDGIGSLINKVVKR